MIFSIFRFFCTLRFQISNIVQTIHQCKDYFFTCMCRLRVSASGRAHVPLAVGFRRAAGARVLALVRVLGKVAGALASADRDAGNRELTRGRGGGTGEGYRGETSSSVSVHQGTAAVQILHGATELLIRHWEEPQTKQSWTRPDGLRDFMKTSDLCLLLTLKYELKPSVGKVTLEMQQVTDYKLLDLKSISVTLLK